MHADWVSTHARTLDGVRRARVMAIGEMDVPREQYRTSCFYDENVPAHALFIHHDSATPVPVCVEHLQKHLDEYRSDDKTYPPVVVPLKRRH